jgi:hypothetical protein
MKQDYDIYQALEVNNPLGQNKKNCILYRYTEKVILNFLKDCGKRTIQILNCNSHQ